MTAQRKLFLRCNEVGCDNHYEGSGQDGSEADTAFLAAAVRQGELGWAVTLGQNRHRCPLCVDRIRDEEYAENMVRELR